MFRALLCSKHVEEYNKLIISWLVTKIIVLGVTATRCHLSTPDLSAYFQNCTKCAFLKSIFWPMQLIKD